MPRKSILRLSLWIHEHKKRKVFRIENKKKFNLLTDHYLSSFASSKGWARLLVHPIEDDSRNFVSNENLGLLSEEKWSLWKSSVTMDARIYYANSVWGAWGAQHLRRAEARGNNE